MTYDDYSVSKPPELEQEDRELCAHEFVKSTKILRDYSNDLCNKVIEHGRKGLLIEGFSGKYNVCTDAICKWLSEPEKYPDFKPTTIIIDGNLETTEMIPQLQRNLQRFVPGVTLVLNKKGGSKKMTRYRRGTKQSKWRKSNRNRRFH